MNISVNDLSIFNGEPRIHDLRLADALGFERPRKIRELIGRNKTELERYGEVCPMVGQTSPKGGRPHIEYYLNEGQALLLAMFSDTENAAAVRKILIDVFMAWRRGTLTPPPKSPEMDFNALIEEIQFEPLSSKVALLNIIERNTGRRGVREYMARLGLPVPQLPAATGEGDSFDCLSWLLEWDTGLGCIRDLIWQAQGGDLEAANILADHGIEALAGGFWMISGKPATNEIWQSTHWGRIWRRTLSSLPGATCANERIYIGRTQGRPIWVPASLFS